VNGDGLKGHHPPSDLAVAVDGIPIERVVARLLAIGTYASVALLAVGTALMVVSGIQPLGASPSFDPRRIGDDIVHLQAAGFLSLGLIAVIATPAGRVLVSLVGYARGGERLMAVIAALILAVIALSVLVAQVSVA
jgi:uncharacterized membrane protein